MTDDRFRQAGVGMPPSTPWGEPPRPPEPYSMPGPDLRTYAWIVHLLYAAAMLTGITAVAGVIIAYLKRGEASGTMYESHYAYAIRTFWIGLALGIVAFVLSFVLIGVLVFALGGVWWLIRVIRPIMALLEGRPVSNPTGLI